MYVLFAFSLNRNTNKKCENLVIAPKRKFQMVLHNHVTCWFRVIMLQQHRLYNRNLHQLLPSCITRSEWQHYSWLFVYIPVEIRFPFTFFICFLNQSKMCFCFSNGHWNKTKNLMLYNWGKEVGRYSLVLICVCCIVCVIVSRFQPQSACRSKGYERKEWTKKGGGMMKLHVLHDDVTIIIATAELGLCSNEWRTKNEGWVFFHLLPNKLYRAPGNLLSLSLTF